MKFRVHKIITGKKRRKRKYEHKLIPAGRNFPTCRGIHHEARDSKRPQCEIGAPRIYRPRKSGQGVKSSLTPKPITCNYLNHRISQSKSNPIQMDSKYVYKSQEQMSPITCLRRSIKILNYHIFFQTI